MKTYFIYILVAVGVIAMQYFGIKRTKKLNKRREQLKKEAEKLQLRYQYYTDNYETRYLKDFSFSLRSTGDENSLIRSDEGVYHVVSGTYQQHSFTSFEYIFNFYRNSAVNKKQTVFVFFDITSQVSDFRIRPNNNLIDAMKKEHDNASVNERFNNQFKIKGDVNTLSSEFLKTCLEYPEVRIQKVGNSILFYEDDYCIKPENLQANLDYYSRLVASL